MALTVKVNNIVVDILNDNNCKVDKTIDMSNTATFTTRDLTGSQHWQPGQPVSIVDSSLGQVFWGYIDNVDETNLYPTSTLLSKCNCVGTRYLADKRYWNGQEFDQRLAGDIFTEFIAILAQDGVKAQFNKAHDSSFADWSTGTQTNTAPSIDLDGCLELAPAGSPRNITWGIGQVGVVNTVGAEQHGNTYTCASCNALQFEADCVVPNLGNAYIVTKIWSGSHTIAVADYLYYDIWINGNSPAMQALVDISCSDGTTLRTSGVPTWDNQHITAAASSDLTGLANNQWYHRELGLNVPPLAGKTITSISLAFTGNKTGHYVAYFRRVYIFNVSPIVPVFMDNTTATQQLPQIIGNSGYTNMQCNIVTAYEKSATIVGALSLNAVKIYKSSLVNWNVDLPDSNCSATTTMAIDAAPNSVFLAATNNAPVPGLIPGADVTGQQVTWFLFMSNNGPDPNVTPVFHNLSIQVNPSYAATKSDFRYKIKVDADYATGVLSNNLTEANSVLQMNGYQANLQTSIPGSTRFGNAGPNHYLNNRTLALRSDNSTDVRLRMDFAGSTWADGVMELDVQVPDNASNGIGFVYRCSNWGTGNNTFAYTVMLSSTALQLARGVNSTASTAQTLTSIQSAVVALNAGDWHRLKVVFIGSTHQVYLDDALFITATDATYTAAGYVGLRFLNGSAVNGLIGYVYNFGIAAALSGTWVSPSFSLAGVGTVLTAFTRTQGQGDASQSALLTEISYDGGVTWNACSAPPIATTNTGSWTYDSETIPGLAPGTNTSTLTNCKLRLTLSVSSVAAHIETNGTMFYVISGYNASGQRYSRALSINGVSRIGSASLSWQGQVFPNTNILLETSTDGITWNTAGAGASGGVSIPGYNVQSIPLLDSFDTISTSSYLNTSHPGDGAPATWYNDIPHSRLQATGGLKALYLNNALSFNDGSILADLDYSNGGGLVCSYGSVSGSIQYYYLVVNDSTASIGSPNTATLYKQGASSVSTLASTSISFTHGDPHRFILQNIAGVLTAFMDGVSILTFDDNPGGAPLLSGQAGFFNNGGTAEFYQLYIQGLGSALSSGSSLSTRVTLTSTDPTQTPQLADLAVSIRAGNIYDGALIPNTKYSVLNGSTNTIAQNADDLTKQSNAIWWIDDALNANFQHKLGQPAPWILFGSAMIVGSVKVSNVQSGYRNVKWLNNANDFVPKNQKLIGDGQSTSWDLGYPVQSINSMFLDNYFVTFAPKGQTGAQFYYEEGKTTITADPATRILGGLDTLVVDYLAQVSIIIQMRHHKSKKKRAGIDGTSGAVELVQDATGLNKLAALQFALGLLDEFSQTGRQIQFTTMSAGLAPGMLLTVFLPQYNLFDDLLVITDVSITWQKTVQNGIPILQPFFAVTAVEGAIVGDWTRMFTRLGKL